MPAIPFEISQKIAHPIEKQQEIIDAVFGPKPVETPIQAAENGMNASFQDWINSRKKAAEQEKTDAVKMAKYNALGNALTTMVQPLGWAAGGTTAGVLQFDNRQYLDAFNRAVKANEELRNIGSLESEYQFKLASDEYKRQRALQDYESKAAIEMKKQEKLFDLRSQLNKEQIEGRIAVAEASAKAKYRFSTNGKRATESVRDNLLKRANTAYANILADYYKKKQVGIENLKEPPTYDDFLKQFASENGYEVAESQNANPTATETEDFSGYKRGGSGNSNAASGGDDFSQYKRK